MKKYLYVAKNIKGECVKGKYLCNSYEDLKKYIRINGFFLIKYKLIDKSKYIFNNINIKNICLFLNMLYILQSSGIPITKSFDILQQQFNGKISKNILRELKIDINDGLSLYESMIKHDNIFPRYMLKMIKIGEESGKLDTTFEKLYKYYSDLYINKKKLKSSMIYPLITFIVSICASNFFIIKIIPNISQIITSSGGQIPYITEIFIKLHNMFCKTSIIVLVFLIIAKCIHVNKKLYFIDLLKFRIPIYNKIYIMNEEITFINGFYNLVSSGINIIDIFKILIDTSDNKLIKKQYIESLNNLNKGFKLHEAIKSIKILQPFVLSMIHSGEISGNLDSNLNRIQKILQNNYKIFCDKVINLIEPISIIAISIFVGFMVIAVVLPIVNMSTSIQL